MMVNALWKPSEHQRLRSSMALFEQHITKTLGRSFVSYRDLQSWSVKDSPIFWESLSNFVGVQWIAAPTQACRRVKPGMRGVEWFPDGTLNFAANLLPTPSRKEVLTSFAEGAPRRSLTAQELYNAVARCAASLKAQSVGPGDCVAGVLANGPEAVIAMLATASIGAVWSSCSPDFGANGIYDRLSQVKPKVLFVTAQYYYGGKKINALAASSDAIERLRPAPTVVLCDHLDPKRDEFGAFCGGWKQLDTGSDTIDFEPRAFSDPLYILFSSGTTGMPKCIVHGVGGTLLQHKKELMLHSDIGEGDTLFYFTTCGWMMWNWMVSALACGARVITYDGGPTYPQAGRLWDIVNNEKVTHFGTSPKFLGTCTSANEGSFTPLTSGSFSQLRTILSTGSPLLPAHFDWVYKFFPKVHLASISGGTDIVSCFMLGNPTLPVYAGEIQCAGLGMAVEAWDETGTPVYGKKGELVCVAPFVSMPVSFLNDPEGTRYHHAYFAHYKHKEVWRHGDFVEITDRGGIVVYGRSDATLNPGGVRIGTSEIYRAVEGLLLVADSIAIGQRVGDDTRIVLFVKIQSGHIWEAASEQQIRSTIRSALTPRHVPSVVLPVQDIPYTRSGKKVEIAVTQTIHGEHVPNLSALANPECLKEYAALRAKLEST